VPPLRRLELPLVDPQVARELWLTNCPRVVVVPVVDELDRDNLRCPDECTAGSFFEHDFDLVSREGAIASSSNAVSGPGSASTRAVTSASRPSGITTTSPDRGRRRSCRGHERELQTRPQSCHDATRTLKYAAQAQRESFQVSGVRVGHWKHPYVHPVPDFSVSTRARGARERSSYIARERPTRHCRTNALALGAAHHRER
jgi:hypothetical protein